MGYIVRFKPWKGCPVPTYLHTYEEFADFGDLPTWAGVTERTEAYVFSNNRDAVVMANAMVLERGYPEFEVLEVPA
jgi:hypothetical protein